MAGNKSQTSTNTSQPWGPAQPALQQGLTDAMSAYKSGIGSQPFMGSTVVPMSSQTQAGLGVQQSRANNFAPSFDANFNQVANNAAQGGLNQLQQGAINQLKPISESNPLEGTGQFNDVQRNAYNLLNPIAGGSEMQGNPYLEDVISKSTRDIMGASNLGASAAGRYGSGSHQGVTERNVGDMASGLRFTDYGNQQNRRDAAIRDVFGMGNQANTQYESDMGRKLDATGSLFNAGQQQQTNINANTGALAGAYQAAMQPGQDLMDVGGQYEDLFGRQLNDQLRIFGEQQNQPWNQIGRLNAIASGAGQMGGNSTATAQGPSRLSSGLGGALGGYSMFGPLGALGGGALGLFG